MASKRNIEPIMKPLAAAVLIGFGALCLHADQPQTNQTGTTLSPVQPAGADSPLVRAAKATPHPPAPKGKTKIVITNETLVRSGGHVSTSTSTPAALPPAVATNSPSDDVLRQHQQAAAEARAKLEAEQKKRAAQFAERANAVYEGDDAEGIYEDPARSEGRMEKQSPSAPAQPPTIQVQKPPTSSR